VTRRLQALLLRVSIAGVLLHGGPASGAVHTYHVNSTTDPVLSAALITNCTNGTGTCTLRAAVQASNNNNGTDTIVFDLAGTYTLTNHGANEDLNATGDLDILDPVNITGSGPANVIIDGDGADRVFDVFANGTTTISGVTIRNGHPPGNGTTGSADGGGILSGAVNANDLATLVLKNVVVTQNTTDGFGGGIASYDVVTATDTTVSNNTCSEGCSGGGVYNNGIATLNRVTLSGNTGSGGGGITGDFDINLTNVTVTGNNGDTGAGIMMNGGKATLVNVTVTNNTAPPGGGGVFNLGDFDTKYTIFSHNPPQEACIDFGDRTGGAGFVSSGHNIADLVPNDPTFPGNCNLSAATNDLTTITDPLVAPLANNGGPTATQALFAGSPALDAGGADCPPPTCDQRGGHCSTATATLCCENSDCQNPQTCVRIINRPFGTHCDIGAFESNGTFPTTTSTTSTTTTTTTSTSTTTTSSTTTSSTTTSTTSTTKSTTTSTSSTTTSTTTSSTTTTKITTTSSTTTTTSTTTTSTTTTTLQCGDVDGSHTLNIGDALAIAQFLVGQQLCGMGQFTHPELCDVSIPVGCDIGDALFIAQCLVGQVACPTTCRPISCGP
jgi:hypothetical protein